MIPVIERAPDLARIAHPVGAEREILLDGEVHEGAAPLRDVRDAALRAGGGRQRGHVIAVEQDRAARRYHA